MPGGWITSFQATTNGDTLSTIASSETGRDVEIRAFACDCALRVAHLWDMPGIVREYLETRDESIRAAAGDATGAAAGDAAGAAAGAAAEDAEREWQEQRFREMCGA